MSLPLRTGRLVMRADPSWHPQDKTGLSYDKNHEPITQASVDRPLCVMKSGASFDGHGHLIG